MVGRSVLALLLLVLVVSSYPVSAITCSEAVITLTPCIPFLVNGAASPGVPCCSGVQLVNKKASTTADRRALCECFKKNAPALGVKTEKAKQLPGLCGVKPVVPFDPNTKCSDIPF